MKAGGKMRLWIYTENSFQKKTSDLIGKLRLVDKADFYMGDSYFSQAVYGVNIDLDTIEEEMKEETWSGISLSNGFMKKAAQGMAKIVGRQYKEGDLRAIHAKLKEIEPSYPESFYLKQINELSETSFRHVRDTFIKVEADIYAEVDAGYNFLS